MQEPTYPSELTDEAVQACQSAFEAVDTLTMDERNYVDDESEIDGRVHYDYNSNPYEPLETEVPIFDDCDVSIYGTDAVITFHFNGTKGHWFHGEAFATTAYDAMADHVAAPTDDPSVGVQIRGDDIYVQNKIENATN